MVEELYQLTWRARAHSKQEKGDFMYIQAFPFASFSNETVFLTITTGFCATEVTKL